MLRHFRTTYKSCSFLINSRLTFSTVNDRYPSRFAEGEEIEIKRDDPVVWGKSNKIFTEEKMNFYEKNGYVIFDNIYSNNDFEKIKQKTLEIKQNIKNLQLNVVNEENSESIRSIFEIHKIDDYFNLLNNDKMKMISEGILGNGVYVHQSRINLQLPFTGNGFYWHSDFETWHSEDGVVFPRMTSGVVLLNDNNQFNGSLMIIPGSHKYFIGCVGETPENAWLVSLKNNLKFGTPSYSKVEDMVKRFDIHSIQGKAGSVFFFDSNLLHGSHSNITPFPRSNIFLAFNSVYNKPKEKPYSGNGRPNYLSNKN